MATTLAPVDSREVVRCDHCLLVQFRTTNSLCRRCHLSLDEDEAELAALSPEPQTLPVNINSHGRGHLHLAQSIRNLRLRSGLSQRQLALRMSVPRTYVSKIENEKATPTLSSLERLARALEVSVPESAFGRRTQPSGRSPRADGGSVCRRRIAFPFAAEWPADVQHSGTGAGFDGTAAPQRISILG